MRVEVHFIRLIATIFVNNVLHGYNPLTIVRCQFSR